MKFLKPPKLNPGDTIGVIAPSLPVLPSFRKNYETGKKTLSDLRFKILEGKTIKLKRWWAAGTPKEQAEDINTMFADKTVKAVMAQTGGHSAISVLEHIDYELVRQNPKPFIGMSDITVYHLAFLTKTGLVGFHMDDVTFGLGWNYKRAEADQKQFCIDSFKKFLTRAVPPGTENVGHHLYDISRCLYQLKYAGILGKIGGVLIGKITKTRPAEEKEINEPGLKELVLEITKEYSFPIMANMDFGHYTVNIPMPLGIRVSLDATNLKLQFFESAVT